MERQIGDLPHALGESEALAQRFVGKQPAVFLDYDGTLTPIRDRPEDAVISDSMREAVRRLAERVPVVVRSEEHTSELQSRFDLVCRLLLEKKNTQTYLKLFKYVTTQYIIILL